MKYFLATLFVFLASISVGQKLTAPSVYQKRMTEMAYLKMDHNINIAARSRIHTFRPYSWLKITFKTSINSHVITKIKMAEMIEAVETEDASLGEGIDIGLSDLDATDYVSIIAYDIRAKVYLPHHSVIVLRCFVTGIQLNTYNYTIGYTHKF